MRSPHASTTCKLLDMRLLLLSTSRSISVKAFVIGALVRVGAEHQGNLIE